MRLRNTQSSRRLLPLWACFIALNSLAQSSSAAATGHVSDLQHSQVATGQQTQPGQLSGTVVDASGALIAGATVTVRSGDGSVQKITQSDANGVFRGAGLAVGGYR